MYLVSREQKQENNTLGEKTRLAALEKDFPPFPSHSTFPWTNPRGVLVSMLEVIEYLSAPWLSWLKRLSSKQEIEGSNPSGAFFAPVYSMFDTWLGAIR